MSTANSIQVWLYSGIKHPLFMIQQLLWVKYTFLLFHDDFWYIYIRFRTYIYMYYFSVSCGRIITLSNNIINQLKLTQTLKCLLQLWKGFFERMKSRSQTDIKGCAHLSNPCLWCFLHSLAFNSTGVSFCLTEDNLFHPAWNSVYVFLSLNLNFLAFWEKS